MQRLDREALIAAASAALGAAPDPEGTADVVGERGRINVAASGADLKAAIQRLAPLPGYPWVVINPGDPFAASPPTPGTKGGLLDPTGRVLKAARPPEPKGPTGRAPQRRTRGMGGG